MTGEQLGYVMDRLLEAGALDVYFTHIQMKKNRPGIKLSVLCTAEKKQQLVKLLLSETSTFGVRYRQMNRDILDRSFAEVETEYGMVRCKIGRLEGVVVKMQPEYEDCRKIASEQGLPISEVFQAVFGTISSQKHIDKA